ncbi:hypothetical protein JAAARDRAFT_311610 [Jaapia argillacea MUCL 33604]|uniref:Uncharacterized protein n=1 Tax=Jaapia argillacea MUCL 33604 TaxID=933084 RepID=A0A067PYV2_9AGAM|nr:hypothetical protein JAAARDRAFT_311610 [Jaapia argillacea MUCL 33604]
MARVHGQYSTLRYSALLFVGSIELSFVASSSLPESVSSPSPQRTRFTAGHATSHEHRSPQSLRFLVATSWNTYDDFNLRGGSMKGACSADWCQHGVSQTKVD